MNDYNIDGKFYNNKVFYFGIIVLFVFVFLSSGSYAYYVASSKNNTTINGDIIEANLSLEVTKLSSTHSVSDYINPYEFGSFSTFSTILASGCGNSSDRVCEIYKIKYSSNTPLLVNFYADLEPRSSEDILPNLKWTILGSNSTTNASNVESIGTSLYNTTSMVNNTKSIGNEELFASSINIDSTSRYYYLMVWIDENDSGNDDDDGDYVGSVTVRATNGNEDKITANFS